MSLLKKINVVRRFLTKGFTSNISNAKKFENHKAVDPYEIKRVLISRPNHRLGNLLLITPIVEEVSFYFPNAKIDLFVKGGVANIIFENYPQIDNIIQLPKKHFKELGSYILCWFKLRLTHYDLAINVEKGSSSGRLSVKFSKAKIKFFGDIVESSNLIESFPDALHNAKNPVYIFQNYLQKIKIPVIKESVFPLDLKLSGKEIEQGKMNLADLHIDKSKPTIALFTYATGSKCYSQDWWSEFLKVLENEFGSAYNLIEVLPVENISQIKFSIPTYYSKDIRAIGALFANTALFIGADSGMMHLASASKTPTIGLFSVTDSKKYGPYANGSVSLNTNKKSFIEMISIIKSALQKQSRTSMKQCACG
uniref:glycosyltransferase family 9 protein n=1 Tax=Flavobacterium sp. TaxID=239 RepID=UPI00404B800A